MEYNFNSKEERKKYREKFKPKVMQLILHDFQISTSETRLQSSNFLTIDNIVKLS